MQKSQLTFAISAVCWKKESDEACSVIRSVGDPLGVLSTTISILPRYKREGQTN